ncbi:MAG TPA: hypothetical protein V6D15_24680 [Oculatellaceae cyanobacterium]|jgi:hypothetical protein
MSIDKKVVRVIGSDPAEELTKREYFAAIALKGLLANESIAPVYDLNEVAESAVKHADALIEALNSNHF